MNIYGLNQTKKQVSAAYGTDEGEACGKFWVAAYTRPRSEKKVASEIRKIGIETYLPTQILLRQWSDRKKKVETVIIPMVAFFYVDSNEVSILKQHSLIIRLFSNPGEKEHAIIPDAQIEKLKFVLGQSDIPVSFIPHMSVNDDVRIARGKLIGLTGKIIQCDEGMAEIVVGVDFLGGCKLRINRLDIERI